MDPARPARRALTPLLLSLAAAPVPACRAEPARPPVVLVSLDTTRADRLGCYGAARPATPHLDRLAADGTVHTRALATSSWTLPSHASLFTGRLTRSHGADYDPEGPLDLAGAVEGPAEWRSFRARPLPASERTLAEVLREGGYDTAGVVAGPWLKRPFGLDQGFEVWDEAGIDSANGRRAESVTDAALAWLDRPRRGPGFLFLNYFDPHGPYEAPEPFGRAFLPPGTLPSEGVPEGDELRARYDAEVAYMDHHLGRFLDGLRSRGLYDRALVVVTADHGELLGEHGRMGHGESLTEPELRIPLIVKLPGRGRGEPPPARSDAVVQLTDVMPIVLHALSLPIPAGVQGGLPPRVGHPIVAEVHPLPAISAGGHWRALYDGRFKLLWSSLGRHGLYELERDPGERDNLALRDRPRRERLTRLLEGYLDSLPGPGEAGPARTLDAETREALRSLGYVR